MKNVVTILADFTANTRFEKLPPEVVYEMKRVILDSIGCSMAGLATERGQIAVALVKKLGGAAESCIFGTGDNVSCVNAAFANGETMNALDFDALSPTIVHVVTMVIPSVLAMAERTGSSGKALITAVAIGMEIAARLKPAANVTGTDIVKDGSERGKSKVAGVSGFNVACLAAAAGAGKILDLDSSRLANAIGISGCICPPNLFSKFVDTAPVRNTKYGPGGWGAQAAVTAALLAEMGYTGDTELFEGERNFWRYTGQDSWKTDEMSGLGERWEGHHIKYKVYPCGGVMAGVIDGFIKIIEENRLQPESITGILAQPLPIIHERMWRENRLRTPDDYPFNLFYLLTCAAFKINPTRWHESETRNDPKLTQFMQRVKFEYVLDEKDFGLAKLKDPRTFQMQVTVISGDRQFHETVPYVKGSWEPEEFRLTDDELIKKFKDNSAKLLNDSQANNLAHKILSLDKLDNIRTLLT